MTVKPYHDFVCCSDGDDYCYSYCRFGSRISLSSERSDAVPGALEGNPSGTEGEVLTMGRGRGRPCMAFMQPREASIAFIFWGKIVGIKLFTNSMGNK